MPDSRIRGSHDDPINVPVTHTDRLLGTGYTTGIIWKLETCAEVRAAVAVQSDCVFVATRGAKFFWRTVAQGGDPTLDTGDERANVIAITGVTTGAYVLEGFSVQTVGWGADAVTLLSWAVASATNVSVEVEMRCYSGSAAGVAADRCSGTIRCTAKRNGTGALSIDSQSTADSWYLSKAAWNPEFDTSGNTLRLRLTPDIATDIRCQLIATIAQDSTADAPAPATHTGQWLLTQVEAITGVDSAIDVYPMPTGTGGVVTLWAGVNGHDLVDVDVTHYTLGTIGTGGKPALTSTSGHAGLRVDPGVAVKTMVAVVASPPTVATYQVLSTLGASNNANDAIMVGTNQHSLVVNAGWTYYVDGVATTALPTAGGVHTIIAVNDSNTKTGVCVGWPYAGNEYDWRAAHAFHAVLSVAATSDMALQLHSLLAAEYA